MRPRLPISAAMAIAAALLAGCGGTEKKAATTSKAAPTNTPAAPAAAPVVGDSVTIRGFKYAPPAISTKVGGKVTFKNADNAAHTATADMKSVFDSGTLNHGQSKALTFTKAGTFSYTCAFHPFMHGTVVVKPAGRQTAAVPPAAKPSHAVKPAAPNASGGKAATPGAGRSAGVNGGGGSSY